MPENKYCNDIANICQIRDKYPRKHKAFFSHLLASLCRRILKTGDSLRILGYKWCYHSAEVPCEQDCSPFSVSGFFKMGLVKCGRIMVDRTLLMANPCWFYNMIIRAQRVSQSNKIHIIAPKSKHSRSNRNER